MLLVNLFSLTCKGVQEIYSTQEWALEFRKKEKEIKCLCRYIVVIHFPQVPSLSASVTARRMECRKTQHRGGLGDSNFYYTTGLDRNSYQRVRPNPASFQDFCADSKLSGTRVDLTHYGWKIEWYHRLLREFTYLSLHCKAIIYARTVNTGVTQRKKCSYTAGL